MSNASILERIEKLLRDVAAGAAPPGEAAVAFRLHAGALEGVPYHLVQQADSLANELQILQWQLDEDLQADLSPVLVRLERWAAAAEQAGA